METDDQKLEDKGKAGVFFFSFSSFFGVLLFMHLDFLLDLGLIKH